MQKTYRLDLDKVLLNAFGKPLISKITQANGKAKDDEQTVRGLLRKQAWDDKMSFNAGINECRKHANTYRRTMEILNQENVEVCFEEAQEILGLLTRTQLNAYLHAQMLDAFPEEFYTDLTTWEQEELARQKGVQLEQEQAIAEEYKDVLEEKAKDDDHFLNAGNTSV